MTIRNLLRAGLLGALLGAVATVLAAEEGHAEPSIFAGSLGNSIVTLIIFGSVIYILGRLAWKPLLTVLNEREKMIRESLESARKERQDAEQLLADYKAQLEKGRAEASAIVEEGRRDADVVRRRLHEEARAEADALLDRARREIRLATDAAVKELYDQTAELSVQVAAGVIGKELSEDDHHRLLAESLEQMKSVDDSKLN